MASYTVEAVEKIKDYPGKDGKPPVAIYKLSLNNGQQTGVAELFDHLKLNPQVGQKLDGTVEKTEHGLKFKPERKGGGGGGRVKSPEELANDRERLVIERERNRSIGRQVCLKSAIEYHANDEKAPVDVVATADIFARWLEQ